MDAVEFPSLTAALVLVLFSEGVIMYIIVVVLVFECNGSFQKVWEILEDVYVHVSMWMGDKTGRLERGGSAGQCMGFFFLRTLGDPRS